MTNIRFLKGEDEMLPKSTSEIVAYGENTVKDAIDTLISAISDSDTLATLKDSLSALGDGYSSFKALSEKIKDFFESVNASDEAINSWKEIEEFLSGVTDTETLTGLLKNLQDSITAKIPEVTVAVADGQSNVKIWTGTEEEYSALEADANTLYFITE